MEARLNKKGNDMTRQDFRNKGYALAKDFISKDYAEYLTSELKKLVAEEKTEKDIQCPLSHAIYNHQIFNTLLNELVPYMENATGLKLYPTYAYARLYQPDDELKVHIDRESCEVSATITLGWEGDQWPIYMGDNEDKSDASEILMDVGDAVVYRGMEKYHWREKFKGKWQAQVFVHYVDAYGRFRDYQYDKKANLDLCYVSPSALSDKFCDMIIAEYSKESVKKELPFIGDGKGEVDLNIRNVKRVMLPTDKGIGATLTATGLNVNNQSWQYDITHSNQSEFLMYEVDGKYNAHVDTFHKHGKETRKITSVAILNDDYEGGKFFLMNGEEKIYPRQKKGDILVFPSFIVHGVEPVTKGIRYSAVTWLVGNYFK